MVQSLEGAGGWRVGTEDTPKGSLDTTVFTGRELVAIDSMQSLVVGCDVWNDLPETELSTEGATATATPFGVITWGGAVGEGTDVSSRGSRLIPSSP